MLTNRNYSKYFPTLVEYDEIKTLLISTMDVKTLSVQTVTVTVKFPYFKVMLMFLRSLSFGIIFLQESALEYRNSAFSIFNILYIIT